MKITTHSILTFFLILSGLYASGQRWAQKKEYRSAIMYERAEKNREFAHAETSPIATSERDGFRGLKYFKPDPAYRVKARLEVFTNPDTIKMVTTTERRPLYLIYGKAWFKLKNKDYSLTVYRNIDLMKKPGFENYLFLPFTDLTSGAASYGGGRYVDLRMDTDELLEIDFNRAYNPYCVYNKKYSCPVPPAENFLNTVIKAGEKDFLN